MKHVSDCWYVIRDIDLAVLLDRAHRGEDPALLHAEFFANTREDDPND